MAEVKYNIKNQNPQKIELLTDLEEIKKLRLELDNIKSEKKRKKRINNLFLKIEKLQAKLKNLEEESSIDSLEANLKTGVQEYEEFYRKMNDILAYQEKLTEENLFNEEELMTLREEFAHQKWQENKNSFDIEREVEMIKNELVILKKREYQQENEQVPILNQNISNSTTEDNIPKEVEKEKEIEKEVIKQPPRTILEDIEGIYSLQVNCRKERPPRILLVKERQLESILKKFNTIPQKIIGNAKSYNYIPEKTPEDMEDVKNTEEVELHESKKVEKQEEKIFLYQTKEEIYADIETLNRFGIFPVKEKKSNDKIYYLIRPEDYQKILNIAESKISIEYQDIPKEEKEDDTMEIYAFKGFLEELKFAEWEYNIICQNKVEKAMSLYYKNWQEEFKEFVKEKNSSVELDSKLNTLTERELEQNLEKYTNSREDNSSELEEYVFQKLEKIENTLQEDYASFFFLIGQIKNLEEDFERGEIKETNFIQERKKSLEKSSILVKNILRCRINIDSFVDNEILKNKNGWQDAYPYIGMYYKTESSKKIQKYILQRKEELIESLRNEDSEKIIMNFMEIESCYYDDKTIEHPISNSDDIGRNYFPLLVEQFHYKNDSFENDFLKAITISSLKEQNTEVSLKSSFKSLTEEDLDSKNWYFDENLGAKEKIRLEEIAVQYGSGKISEEEALNNINELIISSKQNLTEMINEMLKILKQYYTLHSEFDFIAVQDALEQVASSPELMRQENLSVYHDLSLLPERFLNILSTTANSCSYILDVNSMLNQTKTKEL